MKILQVIPHYVPAFRFGGPLRVAHSLGKTLVAKGHDVTVCTTNLKDDNSVLDIPLGKPVFIDGVKVFYEEVQKLKWGYSPSIKYRIIKEIKTADIVITHFHYQYASYIAGVLARREKKPLIVFAHGSLNKRGILRKNTVLKYLYINLFEKKNFREAAFIVFNCEEERELSYYSENGKVIPNGIDPAEFSKSPSRALVQQKYPQLSNKHVFLFLGRLNYRQKGLEILLPAFYKAVNNNPKIHLILAGPDERGGELLVRREISALGLEKYVTMTGMLDDFNKLGVFKVADIFILPSPSEGLSIALLEALYMNFPVITTTGVGFNKVVNANKVGVIIDYDQDQLTEAILLFTEDSAVSKMVGKGKELINAGYTWNKIAQQFLEEIHAIVGIR